MNADARAWIDLSLLSERGLQRGVVGSDQPAQWQFDVFAGRLAEISAGRSSAALSLAFRLVLDAQRRGEPVVWIRRPESVFFPPDVARVGVDLEALTVIRVPGTILAARAADRLVRSGAFGLVVLDIGRRGRLSFPLQSRLGGLAKRHDTALLCLTEKESDRPSLGSLVSVRAEAARSQTKPGERFRCEVRVLKDKRRGPGWTHVELFRGPNGLR